MRSTKSPSWISAGSWLAGLLGFDPKPVPPHVFLLDRRRLCYGQLARSGPGFRLRAGRAVELPPDAFHAGPLGGPLRDPQAFRELVGRLLAGLPGVREGSLVLPDAWLRVTFTEAGDLPPGREQRDEVLRWKLKRLVPFRVDELRLAAAEVEPLPGQQEPRRLLLGFAVEQLLAQIEEAFAAHRVRLGQITNASLALAAAIAPDGQLRARTGDFDAAVLVEEGGFSLVFARGDEPVLHRYKALTGPVPEDARSGLVTRDLKLTLNFLAENFPGATLGRVVLSAPPELERAWLERLEEGLGRPAAALDGRFLPPLQREDGGGGGVGGIGGIGGIGWRELGPMVGAARREAA